MPEIISRGNEEPDGPQIYSNEVNEILTAVPNWMIRWGITAAFFSVLSVLFLTWLIKYPDVVEGIVVLKAADPPITMVSKSSGEIVLNIENQQEVSQGELLAWLDNPTDQDDLKELKKQVYNFEKILEDNYRIENFKFNNNLQLGELQPAFNQLIRAQQDYKNNQSSASNNVVRSGNIQQQINQARSKNRNLKEQLNLIKKEHQLIESAYNNRYLPLFKDGIISKAELEGHENNVLRSKGTLQQAQSALIENEAFILQLQSQDSEFGFRSEDILKQSKTQILDAKAQLENQMDLWEERYIIRAAIDGKIEFPPDIKDHLFIQAQQPLFSIIPPSQEGIFGEMLIPEAGSGKVETGQKVRIELNSYLQSEFGAVIGQVIQISDLGLTTNAANPSGNTYNVRITLPDGLHTTYQKNIAFKHNMQGKGEIITKNRSIIGRIFSEILKVLDQS